MKIQIEDGVSQDSRADSMPYIVLSDLGGEDVAIGLTGLIGEEPFEDMHRFFNELTNPYTGYAFVSSDNLGNETVLLAQPGKTHNDAFLTIFQTEHIKEVPQKSSFTFGKSTFGESVTIKEIPVSRAEIRQSYIAAFEKYIQKDVDLVSRLSEEINTDPKIDVFNSLFERSLVATD